MQSAAALPFLLAIETYLCLLKFLMRLIPPSVSHWRLFIYALRLADFIYNFIMG